MAATVDALRAQLAARASDAAGGDDDEEEARVDDVAKAQITIAALQAEIELLEVEANENESEMDESRCVVCARSALSLFSLCSPSLALCFSLSLFRPRRSSSTLPATTPSLSRAPPPWLPPHASKIKKAIVRVPLPHHQPTTVALFVHVFCLNAEPRTSLSRARTACVFFYVLLHFTRITLTI
jgi:hypothetical protein